MIWVALYGTPLEEKKRIHFGARPLGKGFKIGLRKWLVPIN